MNPRHEPTWRKPGNGNPDGNAVFVGHAGELDVWVVRDATPWVLMLVGPRHRTKSANFNYDVYGVEGDEIIPPLSHYHDVHVELAEMCELYQLCKEHGVFEGKGAGDAKD